MNFRRRDHFSCPRPYGRLLVVYVTIRQSTGAQSNLTIFFPKVSSALRISCFLSHVLSSRVSTLVPPLCVWVSPVVFFPCLLRFFLALFCTVCVFFLLAFCCTVFLTCLFWLIFSFPSVCVCVFCCFLLLFITRLFLLFFCCFSLMLLCFVVRSKQPEMGQSKAPITAVNRPIRERFCEPIRKTPARGNSKKEGTRAVPCPGVPRTPVS